MKKEIRIIPGLLSSHSCKTFKQYFLILWAMIVSCSMVQAETLPRPDKLVIVIEENHGLSQIIGSSSAPYINSLTNLGCLFINSHGIGHPSQPNYLQFFSGSNQGVTDNTCQSKPFTTPNLAYNLIIKGFTYKGFSQGLPSVGSTTCTSGAYARKHNPTSDWQGTGINQYSSSLNQPFTSFPTNFTQLPTVSIVVPDLNNDMHDGTILQGDTWLKNNIKRYVDWAMVHNSMLILTYDEDDGTTANLMPTIFVGPMVQPKIRNNTNINHHNVLRTIEDMYGTAYAGNSANVAPITGIWKTSTNQPPTANAGADKTITLPTSSVTLTGSGSDPDGTIASYSWSKVSGGSATIVSPTSASTSITGLVQGTYTFRLTVKDNAGATGTDDVMVTVNAPANIPPTANAGADKTITLPTNSVTLTGSGNDSDGTIASYAWTKIAGGTATIGSPSASSTSVTGLVQGTYTFRLTVKDNLGATGTDDVVVTVNAATNVAPTANAGADKSITLPTNSVTLTGSGSDSDGSVVSYSWTKVSGGNAAISAPSSASTTVSGLVQGTYTFRLTVTDNLGATGTDDVVVTVNAATNVPPTANAGTDKTITLPTNSVTLTGSGTDTDGTIASYAWTKVSGGSATIGSPSSASTSITGLVQGSYTFRLTVTDNSGATGSDDLVVTVNAAPNIAPTANAGSDKTITLPTNSVTLSGSGTDSDGTIASYAWTKVSGGNATIGSPSSASTSVTGLVQGTYTFRLTVKDNLGAAGSDDVIVTVNAAANIPPTANAGPDKTITLPTNSVTLSGSGTDSDGTIASYAWTKVSGGTGTITSPGSASTSVTGLVQGVYVFRLTVSDNLGAVGFDEVTVTVNAAPNVAPIAHAGSDQAITLPTSSVTLSGSGTDSDGTIASYSWTQVSGGSATISSPNSASTSVSGLVQGTYTFRLTVKDNLGATGSDDVVITVNPQPKHGKGHGHKGLAYNDVRTYFWKFASFWGKHEKHHDEA